MPHQALRSLIPTPQGFRASQVHSAEPAVNAIEVDMVRAGSQDVAAGWRKSVGAVIVLKQRMPSPAKAAHVAGETAIAHEDAFFPLLVGAEQRSEAGPAVVH